MLELEALTAVHGDAVSTAGCGVIRVQLHPHTAEDASLRFVEATLRLEAEPFGGVSVTLLDAKGLGDERDARLLSILRAEVVMLQGEPMLGHLCQVSMAADVFLL